MDECNELCSFSWPAVLLSKNLNVGHCSQTFQPNFSYLPMLIEAIDFCYFIPLSLTLTRDHKVNVKKTLMASFCGTLFS